MVLKVPRLLNKLVILLSHCKYITSNKGYTHTHTHTHTHWASLVVLLVKNLPANAGGTGGTGSIPWTGRPPGEGNGNPPQYSRLKNPMDRGAW